jgi:hypothetical protein
LLFGVSFYENLDVVLQWLKDFLAEGRKNFSFSYLIEARGFCFCFKIRKVKKKKKVLSMRTSSSGIVLLGTVAASACGG